MKPIRLCGYTLTDSDGVKYPCERLATSWRWYQDVPHEDCLDAACPAHENIGGIRMHALEDEVARLRSLLDQARHLGREPRWDFGAIPGEVRTFIQWKGTQVCMDFDCPCGHLGHIDADFAYRVECGVCGRRFELGTAVRVRPLPPDAEGNIVVTDRGEVS